jgi:hypothetical protein
MIIGFTGTRHGMTPPQSATVERLLQELGVTELHHGCCVGADAQVHRLARERGIRLVGHPPRESKLMAKDLDCDTYAGGHPGLSRNRHIVTEGKDGLLAAPRQQVEPTTLHGEGTWTTINYARQAKRPLWIVLPDGTCRIESSYLESRVADLLRLSKIERALAMWGGFYRCPTTQRIITALPGDDKALCSCGCSNPRVPEERTEHTGVHIVRHLTPATVDEYLAQRVS